MTEPQLCNEKHKRIDEELDRHEKRLNSHSEELDKLSLSDARNSTQIDNLCEKIDGLITTNKWFIGLIIGGYASFFFYAVQKTIFK